MKPYRPSIELQRQRYEALLAWRATPESLLAVTAAESGLPLPEPPAASLAEVERLLQRISERRRCALGDSVAQLHFWMLEQPSEEYTPTYSAAPPR